MRSLIIILMATHNSLTASYTIWDSSLQRIQCFECVECRSFDLSVFRVFLSDEAQRKSYLFYIHQRPPVLAHRMDEGASSLIVMLINWMAATVFGESRKSEREHYINNKEYVANVPPLATSGFKAFPQTKTCYLFSVTTIFF